MTNKMKIIEAVSPENLQTSLVIIGKKLGRDPQELRTNIDSGIYDAQFENLDEDQISQLIRALNNSFMLRMALLSPSVVKMLRDTLS